MIERESRELPKGSDAAQERIKAAEAAKTFGKRQEDIAAGAAKLSATAEKRQLNS